VAPFGDNDIDAEVLPKLTAEDIARRDLDRTGGNGSLLSPP
jgi:hypothetical protein